jgi:DNA invertase Pin-like site-specific DNA recombinase
MLSHDLTSASAGLRRARNELAAALQNAELTAIAAHKDGMPETRIAAGLGVNRMTVRRWLGKL